MRWWQELLLAVGGGLLVFWLALVGVLAVASRGRDRAALGEGMRLLPDVIRLLRRLAGDGSVPRGVRIRLGLMLGYLLMPIDLIPDFLPVIGYADDAIVVAIALRSVVRNAGPEAIAAHWPGTDTGLQVVHRLAGLPAPETRAGRSEHEQADDAARARSRPTVD